MGQTASFNDRRFDLIYKTAQNWYAIAVSYGMTGYDAPSTNDKAYDLLTKICYYTAFVRDSI